MASFFDERELLLGLLAFEQKWLDLLIALPENEMMAAYHPQLKDALYRAVSPCRIDFLEALMRFGYPNIASSEVAPFCRCIEELLRTARDNDESEPAAQFFTETLQQMMMASTKADELVFLDGNPKRVLVDGYWSHYLTTCIVLPHATHFFDNEFRVSEALSGTTNCVFVDSKSEPTLRRLGRPTVSAVSIPGRAVTELPPNRCRPRSAPAREPPNHKASNRQGRCDL